MHLRLVKVPLPDFFPPPTIYIDTALTPYMRSVHFFFYFLSLVTCICFLAGNVHFSFGWVASSLNAQ